VYGDNVTLVPTAHSLSGVPWIHGSSSSNDDEWEWPTAVDKDTTG